MTRIPTELLIGLAVLSLVICGGLTICRISAGDCARWQTSQWLEHCLHSPRPIAECEAFARRRAEEECR